MKRAASKICAGICMISWLERVGMEATRGDMAKC